MGEEGEVNVLAHQSIRKNSEAKWKRTSRMRMNKKRNVIVDQSMKKRGGVVIFVVVKCLLLKFCLILAIVIWFGSSALPSLDSVVLC